MPGLFGISRRFPSEHLGSAFARVTGNLSERGDFATESLVDSSQLFAVGRVHLGVLQPTAQLQEQSDVQVLFHGDLYNEDELAATGALDALGRKSGAVAVITDLYERVGAAFAARLDGAFCAAIVDRKRHRVILASDLVGSYPLYWTVARNQLVFGSELRAVLRHPDVRRTLDPAAVGDYLTFGFPLGAKTLASGVHLLPAASTLVFDWETGSHTVSQYASLGEASEPWQGTRSEYLEALHGTFTGAVNRAMSGNHSFGLSLSGGLDSRAILSAVNGHAASLRTHTLGVRGCADEVIAERLARISGTSHQFFELDDKYLEGFLPSLREMVRLTDGMYLSHGLTEMLALGFLSKAGFSVLLRGHGGELAKSNLAWPLHTDPRVHELATSEDLVQYLLRRTDYISGNIAWRDLFTEGWFNQVKDVPYLSLTESVKGQSGSPANLCGYLYLNEHHRRFTVASLELFRQAVEVRLPFVDAHFLQLLFRGQQQWRDDTTIHRTITSGRAALARVRNSNTGAPVNAGPAAEFVLDKLNGLLRRLNVRGYRHYHNFQTWMREQLLQSVEEVLLDPIALERGMLREATLRRLLEQTRQGRANHSYLFQTLLILELWQRDNL
jgi:asparagine synthase (glutamine-hydrolysing)